MNIVLNEHPNYQIILLKIFVAELLKFRKILFYQNCVSLRKEIYLDANKTHTFLQI